MLSYCFTTKHYCTYLCSRPTNTISSEPAPCTPCIMRLTVTVSLIINHASTDWRVAAMPSFVQKHKQASNKQHQQHPWLHCCTCLCSIQCACTPGTNVLRIQYTFTNASHLIRAGCVIADAVSLLRCCCCPSICLRRAACR